jgi:hypothetical protein
VKFAMILESPDDELKAMSRTFMFRALPIARRVGKSIACEMYVFGKNPELCKVRRVYHLERESSSTTPTEDEQMPYL